MKSSPQGRVTDRTNVDLRSLIGRRAHPDPGRSDAQASALIVLRRSGPDAEVMVIERARRDGDPTSGQISLPGGRLESEDTDLRATALREFEEEIGLSRRDLNGPPTFVGLAHASIFDLSVAIFADVLRAGREVPIDYHSPEVTTVFWLPRSSLESTEGVVRETTQGPKEVEATVHNGFVIWGFTRRVLRDFFELV